MEGKYKMCVDMGDKECYNCTVAIDTCVWRPHETDPKDHCTISTEKGQSKNLR